MWVKVEASHSAPSQIDNLPAVVSAKKSGTQMQVHDMCIVHTAVGKRHILEQSDVEQ